MRKSVTLIIMLLCAFAAMAVPPKLATETIFSQKGIRSKGYKLVTNRCEASYFRSVTAEKDKNLVKTIKKFVEKDSELAYNVVENSDENGNEYIILNILNNNELINVGFWWNDSGYAHLFVEGRPDAFK